jgi:tetratricopeptide (TPR) repeat protein
MIRPILLLAFCLIPAIAGAQTTPAPAATPEAVSLFGKPLFPPAPSAEARATLEQRLAEARAAFDRNPADPEAIIWLGRRLAYLGRYREAIDVFSKGIVQHPKDARLYRHRGHRYLTTRKFDLATRDFEFAVDLIRDKPDEVEPDGQPNARNTPTSTLHSNIWYHLALAAYVQGNFARAAYSWGQGAAVAKTPDMRVAMTYWQYLALRRDGRRDEAAKLLADIVPGMDVFENTAYYRLLLGFKDGTVSPSWLESASGLERATLTYGIGAWLIAEGRMDEAVAVLTPLVHSDQWASFGSIAAEADLSRADIKLPEE